MYYLRIGKASDLKDSKERKIYRALEILPGALSWGTLIFAAFLSFFVPSFVAIFAILFALYWFFRAIFLAFHLGAGFKRMKAHEKTDWLKKLDQLATSPYLPVTNNWKDIYHLIILPMYKEPLEIVRESFLALKNTDYPKDKMIVVLSCEERARDHGKKVAQAIKKEFSDSFFKLLITFHPKDLPGEIPGHGSNDAWAAKKAKEEIIDPLKIPYENIIVSSFDIDTVVFPKYFSCLTYHYLTCKKPTRTSFQPIPLYINNIWQAPAISQVFSFSATFWQIMNQERPEKMLTFSSHSMSFKALSDVGFKQTNIISDDSRIFWQCFFRYDGDYSVCPLYYPVSMDANVAPTFLKTLKNIYKQQKRWAYGVGDIPYFLFGFLKNKKIPLKKKISLGFELINGHWSWATASILIFFLGWLPILLGGAEFGRSLISFNLPKMTSRILTLSMIGILTSIYFGLALFPKRPSKKLSFKHLTFALGWFLIPFVMIFLNSLPALDAQARWMFGKYMGFWVTPKIRK